VWGLLRVRRGGFRIATDEEEEDYVAPAESVLLALTMGTRNIQAWMPRDGIPPYATLFELPLGDLLLDPRGKPAAFDA
jgi:hypothetical protein